MSNGVRPFENKRMGLIASIKRNFANSSARVQAFLYVVDDITQLASSAEPLIAFACTGLELHNFARDAKKGFLAILNENPDAYRQKIRLPEDYWRLAIRVVANELSQNKETDAASDLCRDALCVVIESAFDTFSEKDICTVFLSRNGEVVVERLPGKSPFDLSRAKLGNVNEPA